MDVARGRALILHMHLFKNAGTTLDWSLARAFGEAFCDHRDDASMRGNPAFLAQFVGENPALEAISSHWLPLPIPQLDARIAYPVAFLRDPIERIASVYAFERQQAVDHPGTRRARTSTLAEYVRWRLEAGTGPVIRNYQMRMFSGDYPGEGDEAQYEMALENLKLFPVVGLLEDYARSVVLLESALRPGFAEIDLAWRPQNVRDPGDVRTAQERRLAVEHELGSLRDAVLEANRLDLALVEHVRARLERQWTTLADAAARRVDLEERCRRLADA